ncbi:anti-sigma factor [Nocardiaceae bacterium NPDC056970]|jgi:serine/threonine-protein kinase RsbW
MQTDPTPEVSPVRQDTTPAVTVSVAARHDQLPILRMLTEVVAMRNNCTLDQSADLKLAVDQICTLLISSAAPDTEVTCRYTTVDDTFRIVLTAFTVAEWYPERGSLEWRILSALADSIAIDQQPDASGHTTESTVTICTRKLV